MRLLADAQRPLFVIGGGILREVLTAPMQRLAELSSIPVASLQYYPDGFPSTHPLALGPLGRNGWASANRTAPRADVIVAIGAHIDVYSTTFRYGVFSRDAKLVQHSTVPSVSASCSPSSLR
jgi:thiamine pyrophosphate-dependent acetolactate synthase large subunit-like protein